MGCQLGAGNSGELGVYVVAFGGAGKSPGAGALAGTAVPIPGFDPCFGGEPPRRGARLVSKSRAEPSGVWRGRPMHLDRPADLEHERLPQPEKVGFALR